MYDHLLSICIPCQSPTYVLWSWVRVHSAPKLIPPSRPPTRIRLQLSHCPLWISYKRLTSPSNLVCHIRLLISLHTSQSISVLLAHCQVKFVRERWPLIGTGIITDRADTRKSGLVRLVAEEYHSGQISHLCLWTHIRICHHLADLGLVLEKLGFVCPDFKRQLLVQTSMCLDKFSIGFLSKTR